MLTNDIELVCFDVDGVLLDGRSIHLRAFNRALRECGIPEVTEEYHDSRLDSLSTLQKLKVMREDWANVPQLGEPPIVPPELDDHVDDLKRLYTNEEFGKLPRNERLVALFSWLKVTGRKVAVCTNARRSSTELLLDRLGLSPFVDLLVSTSDGVPGKPAPDLYSTAIANLGTFPWKTLILEDSPVGLRAARASRAWVLPVFDHEETSRELVERYLETCRTGLTVLVPMAGEGSRFQKAGFTLPKPLIDVRGKPMFQRVVESLGMPEARLVFLVRKEHERDFDLASKVSAVFPWAEFVPVDGLTEGAACTTLLAEGRIDPYDWLVIANSDQLVEWDADAFLQRMSLKKADAGIATFRDPTRNPKWSYVRTSPAYPDHVLEVVEKRAVSDRATCGVYFWHLARDYFDSVRRMMEADGRVNGEFYVAPSFNYLGQGRAGYQSDVLAHDVARMVGLGTPEDLSAHLATPVVQTPIRVAVCLSGHVRCFEQAWPQTLESLKRGLLPGDELDVFLHTWDVGEYAKPHQLAGGKPETTPFDRERVVSVFRPKAMVVERWSDAEGSRADNMFRKMEFCWELAERCEDGFDYDYVVRARPDGTLLDSVDFRSLPKDGVVIPEGGDHGGLNDRFAVGPRRPMWLLQNARPVRPADCPPNEQPYHPESCFRKHIELNDVRVERRNVRYGIP